MAETLCKQAIYGNSYLDLIIEYSGEVETIYQQYDPSCVQFINYRYAVIHLDGAVYPPYSIAQYGYHTIPKCFGLMDQSSMQEIGVIRVQELEALQLRGRGILIGMIDTGIDYTNPIFQNADRSSRIVSIWDQTIEQGTSPEAFPYGAEYTKEMIDMALKTENPRELVPTVDENGHGTFLAGIAAGRRDEEGNFIGAAPDSELVVVKVKEAKQSLKKFHELYTDQVVYQENDIMTGLAYLLRVARRLLRPMAICIGFGSNQGGKEGKGPISSYLSGIAESSGVCVVACGGNEGLARNHYYGGGRKGQYVESVELNVGIEQGFSMELWGRSPNTYSISLRSPGGEVIPRIPPGLVESREVQLILERTRVRVDYQLIESGTGDEVIVLAFENPTQGIWTIDVYCDELSEFGFHIWLPINNFLSEDTYFIRSNPDTTLVVPGTTPSVITLNAYRHTDNSLYLESSRGYGRGCEIKPDMAAPGVDVYGPNTRHGYTRKSGSSIAAAHGTGVAALLLEWGILRGNAPNMDTNEVKKLLIRGAVRSGERVYPNREWGYGRLNIFETFQRLTRL